MAAQAPNIAAVMPSAHAQLTISTRPIPTPGPGELLVRNAAIAANPADWKIQSHMDFITTFPNVLGSDVAGTVLAIGPSVTKFQPGDRVTGFAAVIYNQNIDHGAWQTYTLLREIATTRIPDTLTFDDAAVLPMAVTTSAVALFVTLGLPLPRKKPEAEDKKRLAEITSSSVFLVWGAASSVGAITVQIASRALGFRVIAVASKAHHGWLRDTCGAAATVDYREPDVLEQVRAAAERLGGPGAIKYALDAIGEGETPAQVAALMEQKGQGAGDGPQGGEGKLATLAPWPESVRKPEGVEVMFLAAFFAFTKDAAVGEYIFNDWLGEALADGTIVPAPKPEVVPGGVHKTQEVWDLLKKGVSGKKLIVQVA